MAGVVADYVCVESAGDSGKASEDVAVAGRARESSDEAAAIGVARCVDLGGVDAVVVGNVVDEVGREVLVADTGCGVCGTFPVSLTRVSKHNVDLVVEEDVDDNLR